MGIPQITAIMGMCVAGGAYLPVMCDHILMTEGSGLFLAGPALVQAAIGQKYSAEELGGAKMHAQISGTVDFREPDDDACIGRIRSLVDKMGAPNRITLQPHRGARAALSRERDLRHLRQRSRQAVRHARNHRAHRGRQRVRRISTPNTARPCSAVTRASAAAPSASSPTRRQHVQHDRPRPDQKRIEFGGVIYTESAEKAARFIMDCNQNLVPLIFLHDVNGFMVGSDAEWSGIIRAGAKMVNAVSNSVVPKITVIFGGSFGAGHYAMCGKAYDPRFIFAWPTARYAVMSGDAAAGTLAEIKIKQLEREGKKARREGQEGTLTPIKATYDHQTRPALRRRPPLGRRHHRPRPYPRSPYPRPRSRRAKSCHPRIQNGRAANLTKTEVGILLLVAIGLSTIWYFAGGRDEIAYRASIRQAAAQGTLQPWQLEHWSKHGLILNAAAIGIYVVLAIFLVQGIFVLVKILSKAIG